MVTIQLISEDFSARDLKSHLDDQGLLQDLNVSLVKGKKKGLSFVHDCVQIIIDNQDILKGAVIGFVIKEALTFAKNKAMEFLNPKAHILILFSNGEEKKIPYAGKSNKSVVRELLAEVNDDEIIQIVFKS